MLDDNTLVFVVLGAAICLLGILHALLGPSRIPSVLPREKDFCKYPLLKKESLSHDTRKFTFGLPAGHVLGLPTGQHMTMKLVDPVDGKTHQRSYTPVTDNSDIGIMSFVIKIYKAGVHPKFPEGGKMSQHLDSLKIGDVMDMKGPKGHLDYKRGGNFTVKPLGKPMETRQTNQILMIAGGTGITPMLQILQFIFKNPGDPTIQVRLIYANQCK
jgi:cytochrome-b5 reductase